MVKQFVFLTFLSITTIVVGQNDFNYNWQENIIKLKSHKLESNSTDLINIGKSIGNSEIVGLGETTHGTHEIFELKHRIIKYLIEEKGFNIIAFESNKPETDLINQYIQGGEGDPKKLLKGIYFWTWQTQEILNLITWLRKYNLGQKKKVQFLGIDMQYNNQALKNLEALYQSNLEVKKIIDDIKSLSSITKKSKIDFEKINFYIDDLKRKAKVENRSKNEVVQLIRTYF